MRKQMVVLLAGALLMMAPVSASALTISIYDSSDTISINNWKNGFNSFAVVETFEGIAHSQSPSWYQSLATGIGTFTAFQGQYGTGNTSYYATHNNSTDPYFAIRQDTNGRNNTTPGEKWYLDSADITQMQLSLVAGVTDLYFYFTDPSDIGAITTTNASSSVSVSESINYPQNNGSNWFVGIKSEGSGDLQSIFWSTTYQSGAPYLNDGYGLDDFTVATVTPVPEPGTIVLLAVGMMFSLALFGRLGKNNQA